MRKEIKFVLNENEYTAFELRVKDIKNIISEGVENTSFNILDHVELFTDCPIGTVEDLTPSEAGPLIEAIKKVNAFFLTLLEEMGQKETVLQQMKAILIASFAR